MEGTLKPSSIFPLRPVATGNWCLMDSSRSKSQEACVSISGVREYCKHGLYLTGLNGFQFTVAPPYGYRVNPLMYFAYLCPLTV